MVEHLADAAGVVGVLVGEYDVPDARPSGPGFVQDGADRLAAAAHTGIDDGGLVAAHEYVGGHEPEVDTRPLQLAGCRLLPGR